MLFVVLIFFASGCGKVKKTKLIEKQITVNSASSDGIKFVATETGTYEINYIGGTYRYLPEDDPNWSKYGGWRTGVDLYINKEIKWGAVDEWGLHSINSDKFVEKGKKAMFDLNKGEYIIAVVSDGTKTYFDNYGAVNLQIVLSD